MKPRPFNCILRRFKDDLSKPDYARVVASLRAVTQKLQRLRLPVRLDFGRDWEYAHVILELERLKSERDLQDVLDFGGGNSPLAYTLAERGFSVTVLDTDVSAVEDVRANAAFLGLHADMRALHYAGGAWPFAGAQFDCVVSISVFESLLRRDRMRFFSELRRVLRPRGSLLLTFDYGAGARSCGDPPTSLEEIQAQIIAPSGLELVGPPPEEPAFDPSVGPPVKVVVPSVDGYDYRVAEYTFAALHLRKAP